MANVIKLKRGTSTPTTSDIVDGEVAIDKSAQKFYVNDGGTVKEIGGGGGLTSDAQNNTVGGSNAGDSFSGTDATNNTLIGFDAGTDITTADNAACFGYKAGANLTTAFNMTALGAEALTTNTTGSFATAVGYRSQASSASSFSSESLGHKALENMTTAAHNCAFGRNSLHGVTTGSFNVAIGYYAGGTGSNKITTGGNNILIGYQATASANNVSNEITLGDTNITKLRIPGLSFSISATAVTNGAAFYENAKTVAADYTLSGSNAMAAGPITINSSVTVTVSSGDTLTIV